MKRLLVFFVLVMCFSLISCTGMNELKRENERLHTDNITLHKDKKVLEDDNRMLGEEVAYLKSHRERLTPITWEIVNEAGGNKLKDLDYFLSAPLKLITNNHDRNYFPREGILVVEDKNTPEEVLIQSSHKGKIANDHFNPKNKDSFVISFQERDNVKLKFEIDKARNCYILAGVVNSEKNLTLSSDVIPPYLCILLDYKNDDVNPLFRSLSKALEEPPAPKPKQDVKVERFFLAPPQVPSRNILGNGVLGRNKVVDYIQSKNFINMPRESIEAIVSVYFMEAQKERINHDIAIALMCEGTNHLNKWELLVDHNYGDLQKIGSRPARFDSMQAGIRAQIQQMKLYASKDGPTAEVPVDSLRLRRIGKEHRGKYTTLDDLFSVWVWLKKDDLSMYRNTVNNILAQMYSL